MSGYHHVLQALDNDTLAPEDFDHRAHVGAAFEALKEDEFFAASHRIAAGLKRLTVRAGVPEKFHATITQAFMSAIAEAMHGAEAETADDFMQRRPDVLSGSFLKQLYSETCLASDLARQVAVLPDKPAATV